MSEWRLEKDEYTARVPLGPNREWVAEMRWPEGETQGGPAVLVIYPSDPDVCPPGGLSQTVLREVDFKSALDEIRTSLLFSKEWRRGDDHRHALLTSHAAAGAITPEYLVLLSSVYVGAVNNGQEKPLEHLAALTGKSASAIKNHLWQATRKGLLERSPGRAGGHLTDKGTAVLVPLLEGD